MAECKAALQVLLDMVSFDVPVSLCLPLAVISFSAKLSSYVLVSKRQIYVALFSSMYQFFQEHINTNLSFTVCRKLAILNLSDNAAICVRNVETKKSILSIPGNVREKY